MLRLRDQLFAQHETGEIWYSIPGITVPAATWLPMLSLRRNDPSSANVERDPALILRMAMPRNRVQLSDLERLVDKKTTNRAVLVAMYTASA